MKINVSQKKKNIFIAKTRMQRNFSEWLCRRTDTNPFRYLTQTVTDDARYKTDIGKRNGMAKIAFFDKQNFLLSKKINISSRK